MKVCLGGTFDPIHKGHKSLIDKSIEIGDNIVIGLTSDRLAKKIHKCYVRDYNTRKNELLDYIYSLGEKIKDKKITIVKINDRYGPSINEDFDAIVVSPETRNVALDINKIRKNKKMKPLRIYIIPFELAYDTLPISSTRIKKGEIDVNGHKTSK